MVHVSVEIVFSQYVGVYVIHPMKPKPKSIVKYRFSGLVSYTLMNKFYVFVRVESQTLKPTNLR